MLGCMFLMPLDTAIYTTQQIALPVMVIYPVATVLLAILLLRQRERNESLLKAAKAEEMYRNLYENNHAIMMLVDPEDRPYRRRQPGSGQVLRLVC